MDNLSVLQKLEMGNCPKCRRLMDTSLRECPHCGSFLTSGELAAAAAAHRKETRSKSRANNRRATIYAVFSVLGSGIVATVTFFAHGIHSVRQASDTGEALAGLLGFVRNHLLLFAALFIFLPIVVVMILRWQQADH